MTKRNLLVLTAICAMTASNAFASRARLLSMGTGDGTNILGNGTSAASSGSLFYDDAYNMFQNPVGVNNYKNWAIIEKSNYSGSQLHSAVGTEAGTVTTTSVATAQGGFVMSVMNFNVGVFLNRLEGISGSYQFTDATSAAAFMPVDLIVGGDMMDVKWGVGVTYASFTKQGVVNPTTLNKRNTTDLTLRLGAEMMGISPYLSYKMVGADQLSTAAGNPTTTNKQFGLGATYRMGEWTPYFHYRNDRIFGLGAVNGPEQEKTWNNTWGVGFGRTMGASENSRIIYGAGFFTQSAAQNLAIVTGNTAATTANTGGRRALPINVAVEADVTGWLTARAGLAYRLINQKSTMVDHGGTAGIVSSGEWETATGDTVVGRIGATIHAGKADIDFAAGTSQGAGAPTGAETGALDTDTLGLGAGLFTALSVGYKW